mgnify:CR=1 FL=1
MNSEHAASTERSAWRRSLAFAVLLALALRIAAIFVLGALQLAERGDVWRWGHEPACLAQALLDGRGFSDPWGKGTGASSWLTPPYPLLLAALMKSFGGVNAASALALHAFHAAVSALNCILLADLGRRWCSPRVGLVAAWVFALYPIAISNAAQLVWDTTLVACALTGVLCVLARDDGSRRWAAVSGASFGALLLLNPAPMSLAPLAALWLARSASSPRERAQRVVIFALTAFALIAPWMARNQAVLGSFTLRPNLGVELRIGNHSEANGRPIAFRYHPSHVPEELALYRRLGEVEYSRENFSRARDWISAHPGDFAALTAKRAVLFWVGESPLSDPRRSDGLSPRGDPSSWIKFASYLAGGVLAWIALARWRGARDVRWFCAAALLLYGAPYYVTHVSERYRFPIDPLIVLLSTCALVGGRETATGARNEARA